MKMKLFLSIVMIVTLFVRCKKENEYIMENESSDMVKVTFELPLDGDKSDFFNILPHGDINWGNSNHVEYLYLAVRDRYLYYDSQLNYTVRVGELFEMHAEVDEATDKLIFSGMIPQNLLYPTKPCVLYYFGNNGRGEDGTNVTNIYDHEYPDCVIGKTVSFSKQSGNIEDVGNYHVASVRVSSIKIIRDEDRNILEFRLNANKLQNNMSIAMLDLTDETVLEGSATKMQSYTIKWTGLEFEEFIEYDSNGTYDVSGNPGDKSFVALLPTNECATLECGKGCYTFYEGISRNQVYLERNGGSIEESSPLIWNRP